MLKANHCAAFVNALERCKNSTANPGNLRDSQLKPPGLQARVCLPTGKFLVVGLFRLYLKCADCSVKTFIYGVENCWNEDNHTSSFKVRLNSAGSTVAILGAFPTTICAKNQRVLRSSITKRGHTNIASRLQQ